MIRNICLRKLCFSRLYSAKYSTTLNLFPNCFNIIDQIKIYIQANSIVVKELVTYDWLKEAIHLIKRTLQPSIIRKKRKQGFLARLATVKGRQILNRRRHKKRMRLAA